MTPLEAFLKVVLDDQSYLYALIMKEKMQAAGQPVTEATFTLWQRDWKTQAEANIATLIGGGDGETSNPS